MRYVTFDVLHRNELSGALNGLLRVRQFAQDDAHLFVTEEQIEKEITNVVGMIERIYALFDLKFRVKLSTRPTDFMGEPALWDEAEAALERALNTNNIPFIVNHGDGAFYGPKIDFDVIDALGRKWQCARPLVLQDQSFESETVPRCAVAAHKVIVIMSWPRGP